MSQTPSSPEDQRAYEQGCLDEVKRQLGGLLAQPGERRELLDVRLEGHFPKTRIAIQIRDPRRSKEMALSYALWENRVLADLDTGRHEDPPHAALLITTWAMGG